MSVKLEPGLLLEVRYQNFIETCSNPDLEPVHVLYPLGPRQTAELALIRELSIQLQKKKNEDIRKAAEAIAPTIDVSSTREAKKEGENAEEIETSNEKKSE